MEGGRAERRGGGIISIHIRIPVDVQFGITQPLRSGKGSGDSIGRVYNKRLFACTAVSLVSNWVLRTLLLWKFLEVCCVLERFCKNQLIVCHNRTVSTKN